MYHSIVKQILRNGFAQLSQGNPKAVLGAFSKNVHLTFAGNHALGADIHGLEQAQKWFERVLRIFPGLQVQPKTIMVSGWPWNTLIVTHLEISAQLPGKSYRNQGIQVLRLRFGKVTEDHLIEDNLLLKDALDYLAARGVAEASSPPMR